MPSPYSHSQLSTYENCPLRYKFSYIDRLESDEEGVEAFMGSRVHDALEKLYRDLRVSKVDSLAEIQSYYEDIWVKNWHEGITIVREEFTADNYRDTGKRCIANYYERNQPFDRDTTVSLEERLQIPIDEKGEYVLVGYVDRISKTPDGTFEIHDYKTSQTLPPQEKVDRDRQLSLYQIGLQHKWPDAKDVRLIWHYLVMDVDMVSARSEENLRKVKEDALELIGEIESATGFEPKESALCGWCEFQDECPVKKHPLSLEGLPVNEYLRDDGVQLVNKYMEAISKRKELQDEIEKLQEEVLDNLEDAIFLYAEREDVSIIQGSGYALNLKRYKNYRFPSKKDELYPKLLEILKGSEVWEEVAMLDTFALDRVLREGGIDKKLKKKVLKFARLEEARRIYPRHS